MKNIIYIITLIFAAKPILSMDSSPTISQKIRLKFRERIQSLIAQEGDINRISTNSGGTLLHFAAQRGYKDIVQLLIENGADVDKPDTNKITPLYVAAYYGHKEIAELLIDNKADINHAVKDGVTPLYTAAERGHKEIVELLIDNKADLDKADMRKVTPLGIALLKSQGEIADLLKAAGADIKKTMTKAFTLALMMKTARSVKQ